ncbi:hypothetical protein [Sphingobacterium nematocida]|nr:hypothetical protein [Sphingobacterium nematocida]
MLRQIIDQKTTTNVLLKEIKELLKFFLDQGVSRNNTSEKEAVSDTPPQRGYLEEELVTVKEAQSILKVSRWKIDDLRARKVLTTVDRDDIAGVRLIFSEVEALRYSYSRQKGKF